MKKKTISILLGTMLVLSACGSTATNDGASGTADSSALESTNEETESGSADSEVDSEPSETEGETDVEAKSEDGGDEEIAEDESSEKEIPYVTTAEMSNDLFAITMPDDLEGLYEGIVTDDTIEIYDKESVDAGFGGFIFGIQAIPYDSGAMGGMTVKIGELSNENAEIYDVVKFYPTEVQWDFDAETPPENYEKIEAAVDNILENNITGVGGFTYNKDAGTKGEDLYNNVLAKYVKAANENWEADQFEQADMSPEFYYSSNTAGKDMLSNIGYSYFDLNKDGVDELFLGTMEEEDSEFKGVVYDVYTITNHEPTHVISGTARNRYFCDDNFLYNEYSSSAFDYGLDAYNLESSTNDLIYQFGYKYDENKDAENPWFVSYDGEEFEPTDEANYTESTESATTGFIRFDYTPLADNEDAVAAAELDN